MPKSKADMPVLPHVEIKPVIEFENRFTPLHGEQELIAIEKEVGHVDGVCHLCYTDMTTDCEPLKTCARCHFVVCDACVYWIPTAHVITPFPPKKGKKKEVIHQKDYNAICPGCGHLMYDYMVDYYRSK